LTALNFNIYTNSYVYNGVYFYISSFTIEVL